VNKDRDVNYRVQIQMEKLELVGVEEATEEV
jgi:hypothetical protein